MDKLRQANKLQLIIIGVLLIGAAIGLFALAKKAKTEINRNNDLKVSEIAAKLNEASGQVEGNADAKVTIVEFSDFECPACAQESSVLNQFMQTYADSVKFVFIHYPLTSIHANAYTAATATEAAGAQGKFWEMHDLLFEQQTEWESLDDSQFKEKLKEYASEIGVADITQFASDVENGTYNDVVDKGLSLGQELNLNSTPTIFINGQLTTNTSLSNLEKVTQSILESPTN